MKTKRAAVSALVLALALSLCAMGAAPARAEGDVLVGKVVQIVCPTYDVECTMTYTYDYESMTMRFVSDGAADSGGYFEVPGVDTDVPVAAGVEASGSFRMDDAGRMVYEEAAGAVPIAVPEMECFVLAPMVIYTIGYPESNDSILQPALTRTYTDSGVISALQCQIDSYQFGVTYDGGLPTDFQTDIGQYSIAYPVVDTDENGHATAVRVTYADDDSDGPDGMDGLFTRYDSDGNLLYARSHRSSVTYRYWASGAPEQITAKSWNQQSYSAWLTWEAEYDEQGRTLREELVLNGSDGARATQTTRYYYGAEGDTLDALIASQASTGLSVGGETYEEQEDDGYMGGSTITLEKGDSMLEGKVQLWQPLIDELVENYNGMLAGDTEKAFRLMDEDIYWASEAIYEKTTVQQLKEQMKQMELDTGDMSAVASYEVTAAEQMSRDMLSPMYYPEEAIEDFWNVQLQTVDESGQSGQLSLMIYSIDGQWRAMLD